MRIITLELFVFRIPPLHLSFSVHLSIYINDSARVKINHCNYIYYFRATIPLNDSKVVNNNSVLEGVCFQTFVSLWKEYQLCFGLLVKV